MTTKLTAEEQQFVQRAINKPGIHRESLLQGLSIAHALLGQQDTRGTNRSITKAMERIYEAQELAKRD